MTSAVRDHHGERGLLRTRDVDPGRMDACMQLVEYGCNSRSMFNEAA
jgi:hypothetical protein